MNFLMTAIVVGRKDAVVIGTGGIADFSVLNGHAAISAVTTVLQFEFHHLELLKCLHRQLSYSLLDLF